MCAAPVVVEGGVNLFWFDKLQLDGKRKVLDYCMQLGLIGDGYECPSCPLPMTLTERGEVSDGFVWRCAVKGSHDVKRSGR